jgi:hypothetical protein
MTFTVQNDAGNVANANALVSIAEFAAYHTDRGVDLTAYSNTQREQAIIRATDYMDGRWAFIGTAISTTTPWPRSDAYVSGAAVEGIPRAIKSACHEYALITLLGTSLWADPAASADGRMVTMERVKAGPVEKETAYSTPGSRPGTNPSFPVADKIIARAGLILIEQLVRA